MLSLDNIFFGTAIHGAALVVLLFFNAHANRTANRLLAILVALLTITMWNMYTLTAQSGQPKRVFDVYIWAIPLLWAPFVYFYIGEMTRQKRVKDQKVLIHCLPAILLGLAQIPLHFFQDTANGILITTILSKTAVVLLFPQVFLYFSLSVRLLKKYRQNLLEQFSSLEKINLVWLYVVLGVFSLILLIDYSMNIPATLFNEARPWFYNWIVLTEALTVYVVGYLSLRQPEIFLGTNSAPDTPNPTIEKYLNSPIDNTLGTELADNLDTLMKKKKLFLRNDLNLTDLASEMGLAPHHLSQVINQHRYKNFYDYVNGFRIKYAADFLIANGKTNLTTLAFEAGFNNRVSFNNAFRKLTNKTPTEFSREYKSSITKQQH
ncbi:helix-turn-helix transcriptional regulator [Amylibacter sp. SFDW26]|uniref:helix-turn-helix domain-containing protein n=1 Tax=Amylibacter sp. SFDW26 TaxID=2652722 RepID=UPI001262646E|nr:AraC family transcriptional regulator [Amylibacter sp. SFDW26]KAB7610270.1 helix-turn-helix transcriptional regulator [Amylibacter sp. SFDW26]